MRRTAPAWVHHQLWRQERGELRRSAAAAPADPSCRKGFRDSVRQRDKRVPHCSERNRAVARARGERRPLAQSAREKAIKEDSQANSRYSKEWWKQGRSSEEPSTSLSQEEQWLQG